MFCATLPIIFSQATLRVPADIPTIQAAIDAAQDGDTVLVAPGTYNENIDFKGKTITVTSGAKAYSDAESTVINGAADGPVVTFKSNETSSAVLNGFTVTKGHAPPTSEMVAGGIFIVNASPAITNNIITNNLGCGIFARSNSSVRIEGNNIRQTFGIDSAEKDYPCTYNSGGGASGTGILIMEGGDVQVLNNVVEGNKGRQVINDPKGPAGGIFISSKSALVRNNIVRNNPGISGAISVGSYGTSGSLQFTVIQNLTYGNIQVNGFQAGGISVGGPYYGSSRTLQLSETNNTAEGDGSVRFLVQGEIANNIFYRTGAAGGEDLALFCVGVPANSLNIHHNDIYTTEATKPNTCPLGANNLSVDPQFRAMASGDLHEQPSSPTAFAGDATVAQTPNADLDGKARTVCNTIDMGAFQLHPHPHIAIFSSVNPTPGGSPLTFTARLTGNCNIPSGTVTFRDGNTDIGTAQIDSSGNAQFTTTLLVVGDHNITAYYPGDFNFEDSTSPVLVQTITGDPTVTSLTVTPNPASAFSPIRLQSAVSSLYGIPTGAVEFLAGTEVIANAQLDGNGMATATVSNLHAGTYVITARYTADTRFQPSTSSPVQEVVLKDDSITTLTASPIPAAVSQVVTFMATVHSKSSPNPIMPSGTLTLLDGTNILRTGTLSAAGTVSFDLSTLSFGTHTMTARYEGSADFNESAASLTVNITTIGTTLALAAGPNPANTGQSVTLTATATATLPGVTPFGDVVFRDGTTVLATVPLDSMGTATYKSPTFAIGTHPLQATLQPSPAFAGSASPVVNETILAYDYSITISPESLSLHSGDWSRLTVTLTPIGGFKDIVNLSCGAMPDHAQCIFDDGASVSLAQGAQSVRVAINTSDVYGYGKQVSRNTRFRQWPVDALLLPALFGLFGVRPSFRRKPKRVVLPLLSLMICIVGIQGCSSKLPGMTPPGTYEVTIRAKANGADLQHEVHLHLKVEP